MPIKMSGAVRPTRLNSPDPISMPIINKLPALKAKVIDIRDNGPGNPVPAVSLGATYATNYLATTGGNLVTATSGDLDAIIDGMAHGDALLLSPGTYTLGADDGGRINRLKFICIAGDTNLAQEIVVNADHDKNYDHRDYHIFNGSDNRTQWAFLSFKRVQSASINYSLAVAKGLCQGAMTNCYIDFSGGSVSWIYDNGLYALTNILFKRCTFANLHRFVPKYSGLSTVIKADDCLFEPATDYRFPDVVETNPVTNATIDLVNRNYDTATYPVNGHLYTPPDATTPSFV